MLTKLHLQDMKPEMVFDASLGRTSSTLGLHEFEMDELLRHLSKIEEEFNEQEILKKSLEKEQADKMRKKILHYCHLMRWYEEGTTSIDWKRVNDFCVKYSAEHKPLQKHDLKELRVLVTQFERVYQHFLSKI